MRMKRLGQTDLALPTVGLGTAFIGIPTQRQTVGEYEGAPSQVDEALGVAAVLAALDDGCTFFDTAALYGRRLSEKMIGAALRQRPQLKDRVMVSTKAGRRHTGYDFSFDAVCRSVEESLELLGLERLPIVHIHDAMGFPMEEVLAERGALGALRHLQQQGIVQYIGTACNDPHTNAQYIQTGEFDAAVIADAWSLINRTAEREIFPAAEKHGVGLITATPIERGLLVSGPGAAHSHYLNRRFSAECLEHVGRVQRLCQSYDVPMLAVALQWCTRHPLVAAVIPGARVAEEARASLAAGQIEIPAALWDDLQPLVKHFDTAVSS